jgi:1-acyl-sn-glycerol-3-phosphate acyltransferase
MNDRFYRCGRALLDQTIRLYYRRIEVVGRERIPPTGPAIVVANHPNSSTDAFLLASQLTRRKINFIAKDSIPRHPLYGWLVRRFGVVGVARGIDYERQRDLSRQRNQLAVATCVPRLLAGEVVAIFGEGICTDARQLQMIRKGALRFGYAAEKAADFKLGLAWIPVGISYTAKQRFRSDVLIAVGEPFHLADLHTSPTAHENEVLQRGTQRLQRDLESLLVNIKREGLAGLIDWLVDLLGGHRGSLAGRVERHQHVARAVQYFNVAEPQRLAQVERALRQYERRLAAAGLSDEVVRQRHPGLAFWTSFLGIFKNGLLMVLNLYGWANSFVPRWAAYLCRPLGRRSPKTSEHAEAGEKVLVAQEALWGVLGGWLGAALAFPLQTYLVFRWLTGRLGIGAGLGLALLYGISLIPSWQLYIHRRDIFRQHVLNLSAALRFLIRARPAIRLQSQRRKLQRQLRSLLAAYDAAAPRSPAF